MIQRLFLSRLIRNSGSKFSVKLPANKAFKWDSCRVAFLVCGWFWGESVLRKVALCGIHPLTRR
ncbi:DUF3265 domain-containing protein [Vibrio vulnificus]